VSGSKEKFSLYDFSSSCWKDFDQLGKLQMTEDGTPDDILLNLDLGDGEFLVKKRDGEVLYGKPTEPTGFWQYLRNGEFIFPSFLLHSTITGRSSSRDPNAQNFPKRGKLAKEFRKIFIPREGHIFIQGDLSQAELRVAAWMAREETMLRIYREGGDIHTYTAAATLNIPVKTFAAMENSTKELPANLRDLPGLTGTTYGDYFDFKRFQAKAISTVTGENRRHH
jgi:hypothetical protein